MSSETKDPARVRRAMIGEGAVMDEMERRPDHRACRHR